MQFIFDEPCNLSAQERHTVLNWFLNQAETVTVTFQKADGTIRVMPCTINDQLLPRMAVGFKAVTQASTTYDSMLVWSLDKNEWRRFNTMKVMSISVNP